MITRPQPKQFSSQKAYRAAIKEFEDKRSLGGFMIIDDPVPHVRERSRVKTAIRRCHSHIMNRFCRCK